MWPLNPQGELLCCLMIESPEGIGNLPKMLKEVPGIGVVFTGEGDLSQELGYPRQYDHPDVLKGVKEILDICKAHNVPNGWFHSTLDNIEQSDPGWIPRDYGALYPELCRAGERARCL